MLLDLVGIASEGEKVSTNSEGIIEVGGAINPFFVNRRSDTDLVFTTFTVN